MALFGNSRDIAFMKNINRELLDDVIQQEADIYQLAHDLTKTNMYGESPQGKVYYRPVRVTCIMERDDIDAVGAESFGVDQVQKVRFRFLKPKLREINLVPNVGDIMENNGKYYEVDNVNENQYVVGKDNDYGKSVGTEFGESWSLICETHLARITRLQIVKAIDNGR
jgi:hypothetical protein